MQIILSRESEASVVEKAVTVLGKGGIVVYPSDTVYGLAVDATNQSAILNLAKLKNRRVDQKFSFNFSDLDMVKKFCEISDYQEKTVSKYLPGPYTFVINKDISIRIPKDNIITKIVRSFGKPVTATSANITGKSPATSTRNLDAKIYLAADLIIEAPDFVGSAPSTVVDITSEEARVLRQGSFKFP